MRLMHEVLHPFIGKFFVFYFDDILIHIKSEKEHLQHLKLAFQKLRENKVYAKKEKCEFF